MGLNGFIMLILSVQLDTANITQLLNLYSGSRLCQLSKISGAYEKLRAIDCRCDLGREDGTIF